MLGFGINVLPAAAVKAAAGLLVGQLTLTGLALKLAGIIVALAGGGFYAGYERGRDNPRRVVIEGVTGMDGAEEVDFSTFWEAWKTVEDNYLDDTSGDRQAKVYGAIRGLIGSLDDPHSEYFPPRDLQKFQEDIQGNFGGIGAEHPQEISYQIDGKTTNRASRTTSRERSIG